jgi:hypothetical protein
LKSRDAKTLNPDVGTTFIRTMKWEASSEPFLILNTIRYLMQKSKASGRFFRQMRLQ